jgi:hypothetical protein
MFVTKKDTGYRARKKQAPTVQGDALQPGTEAGIDILLYWNGNAMHSNSAHMRV